MHASPGALGQAGSLGWYDSGPGPAASPLQTPETPIINHLSPEKVDYCCSWLPWGSRPPLHGHDAIMPVAYVEFEPSERAGHPSAEPRLRAAAEALRDDGIVVLRNAIDPQTLGVLRRRMLADLARAASEGWELDDNWQGLRPPHSRPYLFPDVIFNELACSVAQRVLGPGQRLSGYQSNTAFAAGGAVAHADSPNREYAAAGRTQRVHVDHCNPHPPPHPPERCTFIVANIPLEDVDEKNGATAVYPGTHLDCRCSREPEPQKFPTAKMLSEAEECRTVTRLGDVVLRDMRLWHGGRENSTADHRVMLALILTASEANGGQQRNGAGWRCEAGTEDFWLAGGGALLEVPRPIEAVWEPGEEQLEQPGAVRLRQQSRL